MLTLGLAACSPATLSGPASPGSSASPGAAPSSNPGGISKIKHVIVIMQENRSFDSYFGTSPVPTG